MTLDPNIVIMCPKYIYIFLFKIFIVIQKVAKKVGLFSSKKMGYSVINRDNQRRVGLYLANNI